MPGFSSLRIVPFEPQFHWEPSLIACANRINQPHEDYPRYTGKAALALEHRRKAPRPGLVWPDALVLQNLRQSIFQGESPAPGGSRT